MAADNATSLSPFGKLTRREGFLNRIKEALEQEEVTGQAFAVFSLSLNHFRTVNFTLGYAAGDRLLMEFIVRIEECLTSNDTLTHLTSNEFALLIVDANRVSQVVNHIQDAITDPFKLKGKDVFTSVNIGLVYSNQDGVSYNISRPEHLLRDANLAMYQAEKEGQGGIALFDPTLKATALDRFQLEGELRQAIARHELYVYYQPIVAIGSGDFKGFEALIRWQQEWGDFIPADTIISVAEETGLIIPVGSWVIRQACYQTRRWQMQFGSQLPLAINVNLSSRQFWHPDLLETIQTILHDSELAGQDLRLEIKEKTLVENGEQAAKILSQLKQLGVQLYMDDFGSSASSLSWLDYFPIDVLTINQSFLERMVTNKKTAEIVQAMVALGHNLGMAVVAKGVETDKQLEQIKDMKFDYIQGYFLSEPLDIDSATDWITEFLQLPDKSN